MQRWREWLARLPFSRVRHHHSTLACGTTLAGSGSDPATTTESSPIISTALASLEHERPPKRPRSRAETYWNVCVITLGLHRDSGPAVRSAHTVLLEAQDKLHEEGQVVSLHNMHRTVVDTVALPQRTASFGKPQAVRLRGGLYRDNHPIALAWSWRFGKTTAATAVTLECIRSGDKIKYRICQEWDMLSDAQDGDENYVLWLINLVDDTSGTTQCFSKESFVRLFGTVLCSQVHPLRPAVS